MHVISNERALAHWQALYHLPEAATGILRTRFINEQPLLTSQLLSLTDAVTEEADGKVSICPSDDPKFERFWDAATQAAWLAEIFRREAGHPLRLIEADEMGKIADAVLDLLETPQTPGSAKPDSAPQILCASPQPNLLAGVAVVCLDENHGTPQTRAMDVVITRILIEALHQASGEVAATVGTDWDVGRIRVALSSQGDPMRRQALAATEPFRAQLSPLFVAELESWVAKPKSALDEDGSFGLHGLFLLGRWREDAAWPVFRKLFSLPGDIGYDLLGDLITEDGSILLAMVGGRRREELRAMVEDEKLDEYCRNACLDALTCLVAWGELPRAEYVTFLRELLTTKLRGVPENEHVSAGAVSAACDLEAWELHPEIEAAYQRGVVDDGFIDLEFFLDGATGKRRGRWQEFCERHQPVTDVAAATKWLDDPPPAEKPPLPRLDEDMNVIADSTQPYIAPPKVGRNDPCPCGSGKKFKKCCGG